MLWGERKPSAFSTESAYKRYNTLFRGKEFGYISGGYRYGSIASNGKNKRLLYHVAKWVLIYGCYPDGIIDHIDGDGLNNEIENLRDVTGTVNARNAKMRSDNSSGVNGVHLRTKSGKWYVQGYETVDGVLINHYLGEYVCIQEAKLVRKQWEKSINCSERHGV